jgi:C4-dicarboxylate-specific signal transduction histidine kinase
VQERRDDSLVHHPKSACAGGFLTTFRVQLQQVLVNLVMNAIDTMASIVDRPQTLVVRSERLDEWVLISVQDSGTGIAPEQAERMFDGLGLSISRSIVESHGGRLSVSPVHPYGAVFQIVLPVDR